MVIGFSTGSLAFGNARLGLQMVKQKPCAAIELSALRESELVPLIASLDDLNLSQFEYVSFHAPGSLVELSERDVVTLLRPVAARKWPIIVHPDIVSDIAVWESLEECLCLENMDKRKATGRTAHELRPFFERLSKATLCFDIGHAHQIDPTMCEANLILREFGVRLRQIHLSLVNSMSIHEPLNFESVVAFQRVRHLIRQDVPIILETPVSADHILKELGKVASIFDSSPLVESFD